MAKHLARARITRALKQSIRSATDNTFEPGDKRLVWREKLVENRIGEWVGPYIVRSNDAKGGIVLVQKDENSAHERYNLAQVRPFLEPGAAEISFLDNLHSSFSHFYSGDYLHLIYATEFISPEMREAIRAEVRDLLKRAMFKFILRSELLDGANALTARFILANMSNADSEIQYKARYVVGGHRDNLQQYLVHGAQTLHGSSARLLLALASAFDFEV